MVYGRFRYGCITIFMITPLRSLVDTLGYTYLTMKIYLLALPINACLNYAFIFLASVAYHV